MRVSELCFVETDVHLRRSVARRCVNISLVCVATVCSKLLSFGFNRWKRVPYG